MKLYRIKKGTIGKIIRVADEDIREWVVRKDLSFMDTIIDPVRYHNNPGAVDNALYNKLAQQGWALFSQSHSQTNANPRYVLAVQYDDVNILA